MNITVRKAGVSDIGVLCKLLAELFTIEDDFKIDYSRQKTAVEMITGGGTGGVIFVAETASRVAGMINLQKIVSTASGGFSVLLEDLYVVPEYRSNGMGKMLLDRAVLWGREQKALRIQLAADFRNKRAMDFYQTRGFTMSNMVCHYRML